MSPTPADSSSGDSKSSAPTQMKVEPDQTADECPRKFTSDDGMAETDGGQIFSDDKQQLTLQADLEDNKPPTSHTNHNRPAPTFVHHPVPNTAPFLHHPAMTSPMYYNMMFPANPFMSQAYGLPMPMQMPPSPSMSTAQPNVTNMFGAAAPSNPTAPLSLSDPSKAPTSPFQPLGLRHPMSPSFEMYQRLAAQQAAALSPLVGMLSPANHLSPLHSPMSGSTFAPMQQLFSAREMMKHQMNMAAMANSAAPSMFPGHPLNAMNRLPNFQMSPMNLTNSFAAAQQQQTQNGVLAANNGKPSGKSSKLHSKSGSAEGEKPAKRVKMIKVDADGEHIKKPMNAFMWYLKMNRNQLIEEKGYKQKQSAAVNKEFGEMWRNLPAEEQRKYYDIAKQEHEKHREKYPGWSAKDNYAVRKKQKPKRERTYVERNPNDETKKCRARFGLERQSEWCKHCRRKKRCLWFRDPNQHRASVPSTSGSELGSEVSSTTPGSPHHPAIQSQHSQHHNPYAPHSMHGILNLSVTNNNSNNNIQPNMSHNFSGPTFGQQPQQRTDTSSVSGQSTDSSDRHLVSTTTVSDHDADVEDDGDTSEDMSDSDDDLGGNMSDSETNDLSSNTLVDTTLSHTGRSLADAVNF